jgi:cell division protein FtsI (penicillin-binding protein 3)
MMLRARRLLLVFSTFLFALLGGLFGRLAWLQVGSREAALARQTRQSWRSLTLPAHRGALRDRHGQVLADSLEALQVEAWVPRLTHDGSRPRAEGAVATTVLDMADCLAPLVQEPATELAQALWDPAVAGDGANVRLGRPVTDPDRIDALLEQRSRRGPLWRADLTPVWARSYPAGATAGALLGFVLADGHGGAGLEHGLDDVLSCGLDGHAYQRRGVGDFALAATDCPEVPAKHGFDVVLTLDVAVERMVEEELAASCKQLSAAGGAAVLLEVETGDVLSLASWPSLDPDRRSTWTKAAQVVRPVQAIYSPGSTFKPVMLAAALDLGLVKPGDSVDCRPERGRIPGRRKLVTDTHPQPRSLSLEEIIVHSSNIGMSNIMIRLVPESEPKNTAAMRPLHELLQKLGIGRATGLPVAAEAAGRLTPLAGWSRPYTLVSLSFGHEVSVTPLQMAAITATLSDGTWRQPRLVSAYLDGEGDRIDVPVAEPVRVFRRETVDFVRDCMQAVVDKGQAGVAGVPGIPVAGKTGTTVDETDPRKEVHSFVALVPADEPRYALVVVLDRPHGHRYAAQTAAPLAGAILRRALPYLGFPTDLP